MFSHTVFLPLELLRIAVTSALYFASIWGWGCLICKHLDKSDGLLPDFIAARVVGGCLSLYTAFVLLGSIGYLRPVGIAVIGGSGLILAVLHARFSAAQFRRVWVHVAAWQGPDRLLLGLVCLLVALQLACAFTPLTFYDSQVYQLLAPVQFLNAGRFVHIPWNVLTNGPQALQLTLGMSWIIDSSGSTFKVLMAVMGCLAILAAAQIGSSLGRRASIVSALFVVAYPEFWIHQTFGVVDLGVAGFLLFGAIWWMESLQEGNWNRAILAGVAFGFVIGSRYQGVVLVAWLVIGIFVFQFLSTRKFPTEGVKKATVMGMIVLLMSTPWLIRNYSFFHNPVFPLLQGLLGGGEWSPAQAAVLQAKVMGPSLTMLSGSQMLLAPFRALLMFPSNGLFGLLILIGGLFGAYSRKANGIRLYAVLGVGGIVIWGLIHPTPGVELLRFNSGSLVLLLAATGALLGRYPDAGKSGMYVALLLAIGSLVIASVFLNSLIPVWPALTSTNSRMDLWRGNVPSWQVIDVANEKLDPQHDKVLLIGETRAVWLKIPFLAPSALNGPQLVELFSLTAAPAEWTRRLHNLGITHIMLCSSEWQRLADTAGYLQLSDEHLSVFSGWLHTLRVVFDDHRGNVLLSL